MIWTLTSRQLTVGSSEVAVFVELDCVEPEEASSSELVGRLKVSRCAFDWLVFAVHRIQPRLLESPCIAVSFEDLLLRPKHVSAGDCDTRAIGGSA